MKLAIKSFSGKFLRWIALCALSLVATVASATLPTPLSDIPIYSANNVPANLMLALSVEFPTGVVAAYTDANIPLVYTDTSGTKQTIACGGLFSSRGICYFAAMNYLGYFDYNKCYDYDNSNNYFFPVSLSSSHVCTGHWSGNMLNWATMTKLDEFRQALTGGYRSTDTASLTVLERARDTGQGGSGSPPTKQLDLSHNVSPSTVVGDVTLGAASTIYLRSNNGSTELTNCTTATGACSVTNRGVFFQVSDNTCFLDGTSATNCTNASNNHMKQYYARVRVCVPGLLESDCNSSHVSTDYPGAGTYDKPEGLIQQNYQRIRVGAAAYVFPSGNSGPNGIIRALLRDNGPTSYNGSGPRAANATAEWSATDGTFFPNPALSDVSNSSTTGTISKSGAINYLNQFGLVESSYETYDTLSELYYVALAYYKHHPLEASYTSAFPVSAATADGFPVLASNLNDPVQYSCQGNAIVTIGDSHTWYDTAIPGSGVSATNHAPLSPLPASGSDPGLNTQLWLNALGDLPLVETTPAVTMNSSAGGNIGSKTVVGDSTGSPTYNVAGMAYYAHTQNMRPDLTDGIPGKNGSKVTVDTYTFDVMEPGPYDGSSGSPTYDPGSLGSGHGPNQYWLAAKYGGFTVDDGQCTAATPPRPCAPVGSVQVPTPEYFLSWHTNSTTVAAKDLRPDNYFPGNRPDLIQSGLSTIFTQVASKRTLSSASPGISSSRVLSATTSPFHAAAGGVPVYQTGYIPGIWTGDIVGMLDTVNPATGAVTTGTSWHAQTQVDAVTNPITSPAIPAPWNTARRIVSYNTQSKSGVPFRFSSLSSAQQTAFAGDTTGSSPLLNYLRGDRSNEGSKFRVRTHTLGDIVGSGAVLVQNALSPGYSEVSNPGYTAFASSVATRAPMVYAGANDGMLHAFAGTFTTQTASSTNPFVDTSNVPFGGTEQFAYVPSFVIPGPNNTPAVDGMAALANLNGFTTNQFSHHFYVDATPQVADADFDWSCTTPGTSCAGGTVPDWHTMLVGGLGKGGKGIYALDITTVPPALDTSSGASQETTISHKVLWEFTDPDMGYSYPRPVVAKTRKYGWVVLVTSGYDNIGIGATDGKGYLYILSARTGVLLEKLKTSAGSLANPSGLGPATPFTQQSSDGTIEQVYAGDLLGNVWRFDLSQTIAYAGPTLLATLADASNTPQPITTAPRVEVDIDSTGLGTRRWVFVGTGRFLDVSDLNSTQPQTMYALRDGSSGSFSTTGLPIARSSLAADTNLSTGILIADTAAGWYYDLTNVAPGGATERIVVDPDSVSGLPIIAFASLVPTSDPCQYAGQQYAINYGTGRSVLENSSGSIIPYLGFSQGITSSQIVQIPPSANTQAQYAILGQPLTGPPQISLLSGPGLGGGVGRTNWREILN